MEDDEEHNSDDMNHVDDEHTLGMNVFIKLLTANAVLLSKSKQPSVRRGKDIATQAMLDGKVM